MKKFNFLLLTLYVCLASGQNKMIDFCLILDSVIDNKEVQEAIFENVDTNYINLKIESPDSFFCQKNFSYKNKVGLIEMNYSYDLPPIYKTYIELKEGYCNQKQIINGRIVKIEENIFEIQLIYRCNASMTFIELYYSDEGFKIKSVHLGSL